MDDMDALECMKRDEKKKIKNKIKKKENVKTISI